MVLRKRVLPTKRWHYKVLAAAYTVLLGLILPFICWGTLAKPGHPHRMAHLVFWMPPMMVASQNVGRKVEPTAQYAALHASKVVDHSQHTSAQHTPAQHTPAQHTSAHHTSAHHTAAQHTAAQNKATQHANTPQTDPASQPIGRSVPDELASAISILSPLFVVTVLLLFSPMHSILRMSYRNRAHLCNLSVLTPPPRYILLQAA